jgi:magnesium-transporting ATPase (P-type)
MTTRFMNGWRRLGLVLVTVWVLGAIGVFAYEIWSVAAFDVKTKSFVIAAVAIPLALWVTIEIAYVAVRWVIRAFRGRAP